MNNTNFIALRISFFAFFILLISYGCVRSQIIKPDEQVIRAMTSFAQRTRNNLDSPRTRIISRANKVEKNISESDKGAEKGTSTTLGFERKAFDLINFQRTANNLPSLKWNEQMAKIARYHSENMARDKNFSHQEKDGSMVNDRAGLFGMSNWKAIGENIAFNRGFKLPVESACQQWMNSPAHRENILDKRWKEAGIGVAVAADGSYYFTEVFILR